jgi:CspA family cold shock protein
VFVPPQALPARFVLLSTTRQGNIMSIETGIVKWFDDGKGYGFITPETGGKDLFAHFKEIAATGGFRSLQEGQRVQFEVKQGMKGPQASNIKPV